MNTLPTVYKKMIKMGYTSNHNIIKALNEYKRTGIMPKPV